MYSKRSISAFVGLIALVSVTSWLSVITQQVETVDLSPSEVTTIIKGARLSQMTLDGKLDYTAAVDTIKRQQNQVSQLHQVTAKLFPQNAQMPPWVLTSRQGRFIQTPQEIQLWDHVVIERSGNTYAAPYKLSTNTLNIFPQQNIARTDAPVTIYQPGTPNVTIGVGLLANFNTQTVKLLSSVDSTFDTQAEYEHAKN